MGSAVTALVLLVFTAVTNTASASGPRSNATYVALGDTYAAGEGLDPYESGTQENDGAQKNTCRRSRTDAYATQRQDGTFRVRPGVPAANRGFWACSGATTETMTLDVGQLPSSDGRYQHSQPRQVSDTVGADTKWITISAGGNDAYFGDLGKACAMGYKPFTGKVWRPPGEPGCAERLERSNAKLTPPGSSELDLALHDVYRDLLNKAPNAHLVVVGYPKVFPDTFEQGLSLAELTVEQRTHLGLPGSAAMLCRTNGRVLSYWAGVADVYAAELSAFIQRLNLAALRQVSALANDGFAGRISFANTWDASVPHNCSGDTPGVSVHGVLLSIVRGVGPKKLVSTATFHPNRGGQTMMAAQVEAAFQGALTSLGSTWQIEGEVGQELAPQPLHYSGGQGQVVATVTADSTVPSWLSLSADQGAVTVGGTPDQPGSWNFSILLQDTANHSLTMPVRLTVAPSTTPPPSGLGTVVADLGLNSYGLQLSPQGTLFSYYPQPSENSTCDLRVHDTASGADHLVEAGLSCGSGVNDS